MRPTKDELSGKSFCTKCEVWFERPGGCNCFAGTQPAWQQPFIPFPQYPGYQPYPYIGTPENPGTVTIGGSPSLGWGTITVSPLGTTTTTLAANPSCGNS